MDIMLPVLDGIEACREIRKTSGVPIIMLTAKDQEIDKVLALELGADDYVTKPFSLHEFLARVKARLRRLNGNSESPHSEAIEAGEIVLDPSRQSLVVRGREVALARASRKSRPGRHAASVARQSLGLRFRGGASDDQRPRALVAREDRDRSQQSAAHHHCAQPRLHVQGVECSGTTCWRSGRGP